MREVRKIYIVNLQSRYLVLIRFLLDVGELPLECKISMEIE